jgi:nucleoid DNA-binding protein
MWVIDTLTKAQIVEAIAEQTGYPKNKSSEIVEILLEQIKKSLESDEDVLISGFGKFCVKEKKERRGQNPHQLMQSYVGDYIKEEIAAEALTRNIPAFSRFLQIASQ